MSKQSQVDRGWAWVVLVAAFIEVMMGSTVYMAGIYNMVFLDVFGESKYITAWCAALHSSLLSFMGPVTSFFISTIGCRQTVFLGTTMVMIGYGSCAFVSSFTMVFLTYGLIAGMGIGFAYMPGFILVGMYFKKYRNLAYGIVTTGSGISSVIFAPLIHSLIDEYGYKGSMLIMAGIFAHLFIAGAVLRPVDFEIETEDLLADIGKDIDEIHQLSKTDHQFIGSFDELNCQSPQKFSAINNYQYDSKYSLNECFDSQNYEPTAQLSNSFLCDINNSSIHNININNHNGKTADFEVSSTNQNDEQEGYSSDKTVQKSDEYDHCDDNKNNIEIVKTLPTLELKSEQFTSNSISPIPVIKDEQYENKFVPNSLPLNNASPLVISVIENDELCISSVNSNNADCDSSFLFPKTYKNGLVECQNNSLHKKACISPLISPSDIHHTLKSPNGFSNRRIANGHININGHVQTPTDISVMLLNRKNISKIQGNDHFTGSHPNISFRKVENPFLSTHFYSSENIKQHDSNFSNNKVEGKSFQNGSLFSKMSADFIAQSYMSLSRLNLSRKPNSVNSEESEITRPQESAIRKLMKEYYQICTRDMILFCFNLLFVNFGIACAYVHLPAFAMANGSTSFEASRLLSVMGISNILSRLMTGLATNLNGLDTYLVYMGSCGLTGIVLCVGPIIGTSYYGQMIFAFSFGLYANCYIALMSPLTIELVGVQCLSAAYGLELFICGIGFLVGPPIAGALYDFSGSYVYSLVLGGVAFLLGSVVMMFIPVCGNRYKIHEVNVSEGNNTEEVNVQES